LAKKREICCYDDKLIKGKEKKYEAINIIVHTNMSNDNMADSLIGAGAQEIIGKVNMLALSEAMQKLMV